VSKASIGRFWLCQSCGKHVPARSDVCQCGFDRRTAPETAPEIEAGEIPVPTSDETVWFLVGRGKLVVMSVVTLGLYQLFWFYQQWRRVKYTEENIRPALRAFFSVFFCYSLFKRVRESARTLGMEPPLPVPLLAAAFILLSLGWELPKPFSLMAFLSVLPLVPIQRLANEVALNQVPESDANTGLTPLNWLGVGTGGLLVFLAVAGVLISPRDTQPCDGTPMGCFFFNHGARYYFGEGVEKDLPRAAKLFGYACDDGVSAGCFNLGIMCDKGEGVPKDPVRAADLFRRACDRGMSRACQKLEKPPKKGIEH
jgi:hypothetical protein